MLKKDKNAFLDVIKENDIDPSLFRNYEKEVDGHPAFILRLENTPLFFMARTASYDYHDHDCRYIKYAPTYPKSNYFPDEPFTDWGNIEMVLYHFNTWLKEHVKIYLEEIETPDLWNQFQESSITQIDFESPNAHLPFSKTEKQRIRSELEQFKKELIAEYHPSKEEINAVKIVTTDQIRSLIANINPAQYTRFSIGPK